MGEIIDGIALWYIGTTPVYFKPQWNENDTEKKSRMRETSALLEILAIPNRTRNGAC
jgi:hypothetical protein